MLSVCGHRCGHSNGIFYYFFSFLQECLVELTSPVQQSTVLNNRKHVCPTYSPGGFFHLKHLKENVLAVT